VSQFDHKFNRYLAVQNLKLSVCGLKVSEPFQINQGLKPLLFLILKKVLAHGHHHRHQTPAERVSNAQAKAGGCPTATLEKNFF
jgi:hypothetical protein